MNFKRKIAILLAAVLAVLLMLGVLIPILGAPAYAAWYDALGPGVYDPGDFAYRPHQGLYFENEYDADKAADSGVYQGVPVIYDIGMELAKDGNIKLVPGVRYRKELTYCWQAWSDQGTKAASDDGWVNIEEANEPTLRPADYLQNGPQMVRLLLSHRSHGTAVSFPIVLTLTDGVGENEGFTGDIGALVQSARAYGYKNGGSATPDGLEYIAFESLADAPAATETDTIKR